MKLLVALALVAACAPSNNAPPPKPAEPPAAPEPAEPEPEPEPAQPEPSVAPEPAKPKLSEAEEAAWKVGQEKLAAGAKRAGAACGSTLALAMSSEAWAGKILKASGPAALEGEGLAQCLAGLGAVEDVCKKGASYKKAFAGWITDYNCYPAAGPSVGTSGNTFELAFAARTPAETRTMAAESLQRSLEAAGAK
jgi:hypothetical protein